MVGPQGGAGTSSWLCQVPPTGCSPQRGPWGSPRRHPQPHAPRSKPCRALPLAWAPAAVAPWLSGTSRTRVHTFGGPPVPAGRGVSGTVPLAISPPSDPPRSRDDSSHLTQCDYSHYSHSSSLSTYCVPPLGTHTWPCSLRVRVTNEETEAPSSSECHARGHTAGCKPRSDSRRLGVPLKPLSGPQSPRL